MIHTAGSAFNPLVIHGGVGLGKTHLLEAIAHGLRQVHPGLNVLSITAEAFTNSFLDAMRAGTLGAFRTRYRGLGALAIDDVHFLAGTRATQDEFLHTFNALIGRGAPIIRDRRPAPPADLPADRRAGDAVPGRDGRQARDPRPGNPPGDPPGKSEARGVSVPGTVLDYIAEHLRTSVRELEGAMHSVIAHALLTGKRLDLALAKAALRDTIRHTAQAVGLRDVERAVCQLFQIDPEALKSDSRARALAYPRMLAMYLARSTPAPPTARSAATSAAATTRPSSRPRRRCSAGSGTSSRTLCCPASRPSPTSSPISSGPWARWTHCWLTHSAGSSLSVHIDP